MNSVRYCNYKFAVFEGVCTNNIGPNESADVLGGGGPARCEVDE